jgi:excinuclease ABC subunit A
MRETISVKGARVHNLQNIDVEIPRNQLIVITGVSGSGKSSLAFDTVYAEGQRRFLESLSTHARRYVSQLEKPDVDLVMGLSPVISIEQRTTTRNPRSTVGTMTDIYDYLRMLFATVGLAHCPYCGRAVPTKSPQQMLERLLALPEGTEVEIRAPVFKVYGEDWAYLLDDVRLRGYRRVRVNGELCDISQALELDEGQDYQIDVVVDRYVIHSGMDKQVLASLEHGLLIGEGFLSFHVLDPGHSQAFSADYCPEHGVVMGEVEPYYFSFNMPSGASSCPTCLGLGTYRQVHPHLLVPDKSRSLRGGAFVPAALKYDKNLWDGRFLYSLSRHYGFSLDTPFEELPDRIVDILFYGTKGETFPIEVPPGATVGLQHEGRVMSWGGIVNRIERRYRRYRKEGTSHYWMERWLQRVMVEHTCPDCGGKRLKRQRFLVTLGGRTIHELGEMPLEELVSFMERLERASRAPTPGAGAPGSALEPPKQPFIEALTIPVEKREAGNQIAREIVRRLRLLLDIGLDYLTLNRRADTLSGGESQRIRLSTQIGSELMGMLYVLDEPSIGLHPKDNVKMLDTLRRLRDIGNTVIVVEHDEATMRAADHVIELGPGPGAHGGRVVAEGRMDDILGDPDSLTGQYLRGEQQIPLPASRRAPNGHNLVIVGAQQNNLRDVDVTIPLGVLTCITGVSGSGKSSLIHEILYKKLHSVFHDSRVLPGAHRRIEGIEQVSDVILIDQSPIGRTPRSNPATYVGVYDRVRRLFAATPEACARGYTISRFSFNMTEGRCQECSGEGVLRTRLQFMADVETPCPVCRGARYNAETLEVAYRGKSIAEVLDLSIEEAADFFADQRSIRHKLGTLNDLGLGYLKLGHPATKLSGGEAQRIKLGHQLGKIKRGRHNVYILDEPTTGLHLADIQKLLDSLNRLVDAGHTVVVIEHHLDVIKTADHVIDLGPEGGHRGGGVIACGTPEEIVQEPESYTGQYLAPVLA